MERTRDSLLLALYALPDPPDGRLVKRRKDDGAAASRTVKDAASSGGGKDAGVSLATARVDRPDSTRKGRGNVGGVGDAAQGRGLDDVSCEVGAPHGNHRLDATRRGCGASAAGRGQGGAAGDAASMRCPSPARSACLMPTAARLDATRKGCGASTVGSALADSCGRDTKEDRSCGGVTGVGPFNRHLDAIRKGCGVGSGGKPSENCCGPSAKERPCSGGTLRIYHLDAAESHADPPCSRSIKNASTSCSYEHTQPFHGSRMSDHSEPLSGGGGLIVEVGLRHTESKKMDSTSAHVSCRGLEEDPHCAGSPVVKVPTLADAVGTRTDLGYASHSTPCLSITASVDRYDPVPELLLCEGEVLSKWREVWERSPLILHDKQIARYLEPRGVVLDLTKQISMILEKHPCNISYFRLDSSSWSGGRTQLSKWLVVLSEKNASEIIIVNRSYDTHFEFPLEEIQSSCLRTLRLGFFSLSDLDLFSFEYKHLNTLDLMGCTYNTHRLYHVVKDCQRLTHLGIGLCVKNIRIHSKSLERLQVWRCSMTQMSIEYAPRLQVIVNGVRPAWKGQSVLIMVQDAPALKVFDNLLLRFHKIEDRPWMRTLNKLRLGIEMACFEQRKLMCDYLLCATTLEHLLIWRMDGVGETEELEVLVDDSLSRLSADLPFFSTLISFEIEDFRGGGADSAIAACVLKNAVRLKHLWLRPCADSEEAVGKAVMGLRGTKRASLECSFVVF